MEDLLFLHWTLPFPLTSTAATKVPSVDIATSYQLRVLGGGGVGGGEGGSSGGDGGRGAGGGGGGEGGGSVSVAPNDLMQARSTDGSLTVREPAWVPPNASRFRWQFPVRMRTTNSHRGSELQSSTQSTIPPPRAL